MKNINTIKENIRKEFPKMSEGDIEDFIWQAKKYIKATKQRSMLCHVDKINYNGDVWTLKFMACDYNPKWKHYNYFNFYSLFKRLGYATIKDSYYFRIYGGNMDMVFNTNYNIIRDMYRLGFITKAQCLVLEQNTPVKI